MLFPVQIAPLHDYPALPEAFLISSPPTHCHRLTPCFCPASRQVVGSSWPHLSAIDFAWHLSSS